MSLTPLPDMASYIWINLNMAAPGGKSGPRTAAPFDALVTPDALDIGIGLLMMLTAGEEADGKKDVMAGRSVAQCSTAGPRGSGSSETRRGAICNS